MLLKKSAADPVATARGSVTFQIKKRDDSIESIALSYQPILDRPTGCW